MSFYPSQLGNALAATTVATAIYIWCEEKKATSAANAFLSVAVLINSFAISTASEAFYGPAVLAINIALLAARKIYQVNRVRLTILDNLDKFSSAMLTMNAISFSFSCAIYLKRTAHQFGIKL